MKIRAYLALMVLAIFIPIFIVAALALAKIQREERDASLRGLKETARAVSLIVDREVQGSLSALQVLGNSEHLETGNLKAFYAQAAALDRPDVWCWMRQERSYSIQEYPSAPLRRPQWRWHV